MPLSLTETNDRYITESITEWKHERAKAVRGTARRYIIFYTAVTENCFFIYRQVFHWHEKVLSWTYKNSFDLHGKGSIAHFWANLPQTSQSPCQKHTSQSLRDFLSTDPCLLLVAVKQASNYNYYQIENNGK